MPGYDPYDPLQRFAHDHPLALAGICLLLIAMFLYVVGKLILHRLERHARDTARFTGDCAEFLHDIRKELRTQRESKAP